MTQKFSQSHFRIQTRSQRHSEGPCPRRLTKSLQQSSQCPMGPKQCFTLLQQKEVPSTCLPRNLHCFVFDPKNTFLTYP